MNKKQRTILLILAASFVWGYLIYVVYNKFFRVVDESFYVTEVNNHNKTIQLKRDTYNLILNYRDPFLSNSNYTRSIKIIGGSKIEKKVINWPSISYLGSMKNNDRTAEIAVVKIMEVEHFMEEGQVIGSLKLLKINNSSITLSNNGEKQKFEKQ